MSLVRTLPAALPVQRRSLASSAAEAVAIPWTIWSIVGGITMTLVGAILDFAWHMSIGRDEFWTPPHLLIGIGAGTLVGIACVYQILATTAAGASARDASVQVLGVRAPAGAFIAIWGSVAMLASAPFDNWWHSAYGLDLALITPPHALLSLGYLTTKIGAMVWLASMIHRSQGAVQERLVGLFLLVGAICVVLIPIMPFTTRTGMHLPGCYLAVALGIPSMLLFAGRGSGHKWGCTLVAAGYMGIGIAAEWLLPLIPAQPKLGPVYHNVTHLIPMQFPLLLIVPAFVTDLLLHRLESRSSWVKAAWIGPAFVLSFLAVQWPFAWFLMSPAARNWIFGTAYFAYLDPAGVTYDPYAFKRAATAGSR
jgi:hypothetical protein